ncbi:uncharacterized protein LOC143541498 [Bidens hawaiensis]|uniref:uncharacterized protein LOC143541498 n=1 Tax=Bidens hawaiensis TaxID=980011 RepID=UPI00404A0CD3
MMSTSKPLSETTNFSTPTAIASTSQPTLKRRKNVPAAPSASKRTRTQPSARSTASGKPPATKSSNNNNNQEITPIPSNTAPTTLSPVQSSSVAKCLFNAGPQTPSPSPTVSPVGDNQTPPSSNKKTVTPPPFTSTNRTVITSETIHVSPMKQVSYYSIERNQCITSPLKTGLKRSSTVKGRLDFDGSETVAVNSEILTSDENTESLSEGDAFDFDLPNFDCLGPDFNLTALLGDFAFDGEQMDYLGQGDNGSSPESLSPDTTVDDNACDHELVSGVSSTVTEILSEQDMNMAGAGPNLVTSVKSITKSIKVFSPVKSRNP